jgi:hypothetical protein
VKFKLKIDGKVKYSKGEQAAFKVLSATPRSSTMMLEKIYTKTTDEPFNSRKILIGTLKSLRRKILANREPFKLCNSERNGPHAMEFWLEAK